MTVTIWDDTWTSPLDGITTTHTYYYQFQKVEEEDSELANKNSEIFNINVYDTKLGYVSAESNKVLYFVNYARLFLNYKGTDENMPMAVTYLIIYIALITFTAMFAIRYIKRVIYIAFLTLMAPMVALTYPLDKIKDRKSTGLEHVV